MEKLWRLLCIIWIVYHSTLTRSLAAPLDDDQTDLDADQVGDDRPCSALKDDCLLDEVCRERLLLVSSECAQLSACAPGCRDALVGLFGHRLGAAFRTCRCDGDEACLLFRRRLERAGCEAAVEGANGSRACSAAETVCVADAVCRTAWEYYQRLCRRMFSGYGCSVKCRNSLEILMRQEKAAELWECRCEDEGSRRDEAVCQRKKRNAVRLCYAGKEDADHWTTDNHLPTDKETTDDADALTYARGERWRGAQSLLDWALSAGRESGPITRLKRPLKRPSDDAETGRDGDEPAGSHSHRPRPPFNRLLALTITGRSLLPASTDGRYYHNQRPNHADEEENEAADEDAEYSQFNAAHSSVVPLISGLVLTCSFLLLTGALFERR